MEVLQRYSKERHYPDLTAIARQVLHGSAGRRSVPAEAAPRRHRLEYRLEPTVAERLVADYQAGVSTNELTRRYGLGKGSVLRVLREHGVRMRYHRLTSEEVAEAKRLYEGGWSLAKVGERFGVSAGGVYRRLVKAGVVMRDTHGRVRQ